MANNIANNIFPLVRVGPSPIQSDWGTKTGIRPKYDENGSNFRLANTISSRAHFAPQEGHVPGGAPSS